MFKLKINNFRGFNNSIISINNTNILIGENSGGKSSLIKLLLLLKQSMETINIEKKIIVNGHFIDLGNFDNFIQYNGWIWLLYGSAITFIPLILMVIIGRFIMKINYLQLVGIMSGSYTDPAALSFSTNYLDSDIPIQTYAQVYPLVTIFRIFVASLLILIFS